MQRHPVNYESAGTDISTSILLPVGCIVELLDLQLVLQVESTAAKNSIAINDLNDSSNRGCILRNKDCLLVKESC